MLSSLDLSFIHWRDLSVVCWFSRLRTPRACAALARSSDDWQFGCLFLTVSSCPSALAACGGRDLEQWNAYTCRSRHCVTAHWKALTTVSVWTTVRLAGAAGAADYFIKFKKKFRLLTRTRPNTLTLNTALRQTETGWQKRKQKEKIIYYLWGIL